MLTWVHKYNERCCLHSFREGNVSKNQHEVNQHEVTTNEENCNEKVECCLHSSFSYTLFLLPLSSCTIPLYLFFLEDELI